MQSTAGVGGFSLFQGGGLGLLDFRVVREQCTEERGKDIPSWGAGWQGNQGRDGPVWKESGKQGLRSAIQSVFRGSPGILTKPVSAAWNRDRRDPQHRLQMERLAGPLIRETILLVCERIHLSGRPSVQPPFHRSFTKYLFCDTCYARAWDGGATMYTTRPAYRELAPRGRRSQYATSSTA